LRGLDGVEPRDRKALAQRLKDCLTALDARITSRDEGVERAKAALIAQAQALGEGTPQRGAVAAARELQQRWQRAGNGRRSKDQAQWNAFRAAIDAVFAKLDSERVERSARDADERAQAEALCVEMESLGNAEAPPERGVIARILAAWAALRVRDDGLSRRFAEAQTRVHDLGARRERESRHAQYDIWRTRYGLCRSLEQSSADIGELRTQWAAVPQGVIAADELATRFEDAANAAAGGGAPVDADADCHDVLIGMEVLAGIESPPADLERRRALQVERLSTRLRSASASVPVEQELAALLTRWTSAGAQDADLDRRMERALAAAIETLP
jgi:hypothetical protein